MLAHNQGTLLNASRLASGLSLSAPTVTSYIDLLVDLLLVRRLRPFHTNTRKRLVKSSKVFVRDSGIVHALLGIADFNELSGHPVAGPGWEGFVIENLIPSAPEQAIPRFYRTVSGAEIDLLFELPGKHGLWAIEIKRSPASKVDKGFHLACDDIRPDRKFVVYPDDERFPLDSGLHGIGVKPPAAMLAEL